MDRYLLDYLHHYHIPYESYTHPAVHTVEESKKLKLDVPGLHTKNLFLKDEKEAFYLICMPADKRLDVALLQNTLNVKKLKFGSPKELKEELNLTPGSVSLFGMLYAKRAQLLIDQAVWRAQRVGFHPNTNTATLVLSHTALVSFLATLSLPWQVLKDA